MRPAVTIPSALHTVLRQASMLLDGTVRWSDLPPDPGCREPIDTLVDASWFMLQQLQVALGFVRTAVDADRLVPDLLARARSFESASPAAIGAAASLIDHVRVDDPVALAGTIVAARHTFGDEELLAAVAAVVAALSTLVADQLGLDPVAAHAELCALARASIASCRATTGRHRAGSVAATLCERRLERRRADASAGRPTPIS